MKNDTSFDEKQHVVWWKTTRRLMKNNTLFDEKQHVVWWKTTRRLKRSKYSPTQYDQPGYGQQVHSSSENKCEIAVECPSLARVYTGVLSFLLSQVSQVTLYLLILQHITAIFRIYFNR